jgi:hypothetical protein
VWDIVINLHLGTYTIHHALYTIHIVINLHLGYEDPVTGQLILDLKTIRKGTVQHTPHTHTLYSP